MPDSQGVVQSNPMNSTHGKHNHNYSTFEDSLSYKNYMTLRFGEYTPTFFMEGVPKDEISLLANHLIDSLSLNAPFKGSIRKITESFSVPNMAILPLNWDKIYAQPANGQDVPKDANCVIMAWPLLAKENFVAMYKACYDKMVDPAGESITMESIYSWLTAMMRTLTIGEYVYSYGSLLNVSGYKAAAQFGLYMNGKIRSYDYWYDQLISALFSQFDQIEVQVPALALQDSGTAHGTSGQQYSTRVFYGLDSVQVDQVWKKVESFRSMLELFRENPCCHISYMHSKNFGSPIDPAQVASYFYGLRGGVLPNYSDSVQRFIWRLPTSDTAMQDFNQDLTDVTQWNLNLSRVLAYQLVCAHYYTNSAIDFIYSADQYRGYIDHLGRNLVRSQRPVSGSGSDKIDFSTFKMNGIQLPYDYLSGHRLLYQLFPGVQRNVLHPLSVVDTAWSTGTWNYLSGKFYANYDVTHMYPTSFEEFTTCFAVWAAIFGYRRSLRFGDYFVGSRPRPLAPINTNVAVNNNQVDVINITKSIQAQRFANAVMRSRTKIENYVGDLFGKMPAPDFHNPFFLTRQAEIIYGDEVQNTADAQAADANSRTANFKSGDNKFMFTFHNDDAHPCIYLQMVSFDVKRAYSRTIDRHFFHLDRYDMFNPDFQYIGDQPVYGLELGFTLLNEEQMRSIFGYQGRDMEYKQRFDVCSGGFVENLPGWILTDRDQNRASSGVLDPDFIRSYNTELDQFFLSLTGFSLSSYFHFICVVNNKVSAKRPMAVDPQILE